MLYGRRSSHRPTTDYNVHEKKILDRPDQLQVPGQHLAVQRFLVCVNDGSQAFEKSVGDEKRCLAFDHCNSKGLLTQWQD